MATMTEVYDKILKELGEIKALVLNLQPEGDDEPEGDDA